MFTPQLIINFKQNGFLEIIYLFSFVSLVKNTPPTGIAPEKYLFYRSLW